MIAGHGEPAHNGDRGGVGHIGNRDQTAWAKMSECVVARGASGFGGATLSPMSVAQAPAHLEIVWRSILERQSAHGRKRAIGPVFGANLADPVLLARIGGKARLCKRLRFRYGTTKIANGKSIGIDCRIDIEVGHDERPQHKPLGAKQCIGSLRQIFRLCLFQMPETIFVGDISMRKPCFLCGFNLLSDKPWSRSSAG